MYDELFEDFDDLKPTPPPLFGVITSGLGTRLAGHKEFNGNFRRLIDKLGRFFEVGKASLIFHDAQAERLRVTHMYERQTLKTGLSLNFPTTGSMLYQVLKQGYPVADNYPDHITTDLIERKILLNNSTRSVLIIPLIVDSARLGLLSLSSPKEYAFGLYLEGVGEGMVGDFIKVLCDILKPVPEAV